MYSKSLFAVLLFMTSLFFVLSCSPTNSPFVKQNATVNPILYNSLKQNSASSIADTVNNQIEIGIVPYLPDYIDSVTISVKNGAKVDTSHTFYKNNAWPDTVWIKMPFYSAGTRTVTFTAFIEGSVITKTAEIEILPKLITITAVSSSKTVLQGDSITLTATVSGVGPYTYKWYKDTSTIAGATQSSFTILNFQAANVGSYTCLVTDFWGDTVRTTPAAVLTITMLHAVPKWAHDTIHVAVSEGTVDSLNLADSCTVSNGGSVVAYTLKNASTIADSLHGSIWKYAPTFTDSGTYTIRIQASTATDSATVTILLHVANVDRAPQFDAGKPLTSYAVKGGAQLSFAISATDPDSDAVSYFIKSSTLPRTAPALTAKTVTWQSVTTDSTNAAIVIGATDGIDTTLITVQVAVGKVNASPSLSAQYQSQTVSKGQTIRVYEGDSAKLTFSVTDPDSGQTHILRIADRTPLSCGTILFDSVNYKFTFYPSFSCATKDSVLLSNVAFIVTDNGAPPLSDTLKVNFDIIAVNRAPVLMVLRDTTVFQSKQLNFMAQAVDPDNDAVTITAMGLSSAALPDSAKFDPTTGILSWTPNFNQTGTFYIVFAASDGTLTTKDTTTIIVKKTDRPPVATAQSVNAGRNTAKTIILSANDPDADPITQFKITKVASNGTATLSDPVAGTVVYTPNQGFIGIDTFAFSASDGTLWSLTSANVIITVDSSKVAPKIITQPRIDTTINQGGTFTITVAINNAFPSPTYSWYQGIKGSGALKSTTSNPIYSKVGIAAADSGNYYVIVSNTSGADTSAYSHLTENVPPAIVTGPSNPAAKCPGDSLTFVVIASGTPPLSYQWQLAGSNVTGATSASYHIASISSANAGVYTCVVSNVCGATSAATTQGVTLAVNSLPTITAQPVATSVCAGTGNSASFAVAAGGTGPLTYQWLKGGAPISSSANPTAATANLTLTNVAGGDAANYVCVVSNGCSSGIPSNSVSLTVNGVPTITGQPSATSACVGSSMGFSVTATGTGLTYQWQKGGTNISAATNASAITATLTISSVASGDAGTYSCVVSNGCSSGIPSNGAALTVNTAPTITAQPVATSACAGNSASFTVTASGTAPFTYQWLKAGVAISSSSNPSAATASLTLTNVAAGDAVNYSCVVTNVCSSTGATSTSASLTVNAAPAISTQPVSQTKHAGGTAIFSVSATGTAPLTYVWKKTLGASVTAVGHNFPACTLSNVLKTDSGSVITCTVSNGCNSSGFVSSSAILNVISFVKVAAGGNSSLVMASDGTVWGFGENAGGQFGIGSATQANSPVQVLSLPSNVANIAISEYHSLFLMGDSTVYACGINGYGQLGDGTNTSRTTPVKIPTLSGIDAIAVGGYHSLFHSSYGGGAYGCGDNSKGQLGLGTSVLSSNVPANVLLYSYYQYSVVGAGTSHSLLYCGYSTGIYGCGSNSGGQVGDGSGINQFTPVSVLNTASYGYPTFMTGGNDFSFAIAGGILFAWGDNGNGQLGDGTTTSRPAPIQIGLSNVQIIAAGYDHSLFLTTGGALYACGANGQGQLGDGTTVNKTSPASIISTGVVSVAAGYNHSLLVKNDGTLWASGFNAMGQLGDNTTTDHHGFEKITF